MFSLVSSSEIVDDLITELLSPDRFRIVLLDFNADSLLYECLGTSTFPYIR